MYAEAILSERVLENTDIVSPELHTDSEEDICHTQPAGWCEAVCQAAQLPDTHPSIHTGVWAASVLQDLFPFGRVIDLIAFYT